MKRCSNTNESHKSTDRVRSEVRYAGKDDDKNKKDNSKNELLPSLLS